MNALSQNTPSLDEVMLQQLRAVFEPTELRDLFDVFLESAPGIISDMRQAIAGGDADSLRRHAHKLKGSSRTIGCTAMGELCFAVEGQAREGTVSGAVPLVEAVESELGSVSHHLEREWRVAA